LNARRSRAVARGGAAQKKRVLGKPSARAAPPRAKRATSASIRQADAELASCRALLCKRCSAAPFPQVLDPRRGIRMPSDARAAHATWIAIGGGSRHST
jgi:hypothetical protein